MGYSTRYSLKLEGAEDEDKVMEELRSGNQCASYALDECGEAQEECKWYDHETEMKAFSKKHPKVLFLLEGLGEESGDMWKSYYKNGKSCTIKAEFTFKDFDPKMLK